MIKIENLTKSYQQNNVILNHINAEFDIGLHAILGKSGSGKTTLLSLIGGMDTEYEGSLKVDGIELKNMTREEVENYRFSQISFVFQNFASQEDESVYENLRKVLDIIAIDNDEKKERIDNALLKVGLKEKKNQLFKDLSGGEKKRISLARGLLKDSPILLLDEPLSSLNEKMRKEVLNILLEESKTRIVIYITHEKEEIPDKACCYHLRNGNLQKQIEKDIRKRNINSKIEKRKELSIPSMFRFSFHFMKRHRGFFAMVIFSFIIALFSISFAFQLSTSISESLIASFSTFMDDSALVIKKKDTDYVNTKYEYVDFKTLMRIQKEEKDSVLEPTEFYVSSLDDFFSHNQNVKVYFHFKSIALKNFNLNSFLYAPTLEEENMDCKLLNHDEICLVLDEKLVQSLYFLLFAKNITVLEQKTIEEINTFLSNQSVMLEINAQQNDWKYYMEHAFRLKQIVLGKPKVVVQSKFFHSYFVQEILHFKEKLPDEIVKEPWVLNKVPGLILRKGQSGNFLLNYLKNPISIGYTFEILKQNGYYEQNDINTHNRIIIYHDYKERLHISEVEDFCKKHANSIRKVSYSTRIYGYTANGYISGFYKPFFFSRYKDKLNEIEDEYHKSNENLGAFQASLMQVDDNVIKADLLSSANQNSILFSSEENENLLLGKAPNRLDEIAISSGLAKRFFDNPLLSLNEKMYALTLDDTEENEDIFINHFLSGSFQITGVYEGDDLKIIHKPLFPLAYLFQFGNLTLDDMAILDAVIEVDTASFSQEEYLSSLSDYSSSLQGSFPMKNIVKEIKITLRRLSFLFLTLASFCFISCAFLLFLCLYLIVQKDKKSIAVFMTLGYKNKEISKYYLFLTLNIGVISYLFSLILTLFVEIIMKNTLNNLLHIYKFSVFPFLISFFAMFLLCAVTAFFLSYKINKITPRDALIR